LPNIRGACAQRLAAGPEPKENREVPPLRYDWAYRLKQRAPDVAGDRQRRHCRQRRSDRASRHVDGAMLGRAAYHTPFLLHELDVAWFGGSTGSPRTGLRSRGDCCARIGPMSKRNWRAACSSSTSSATSSACSPASRADARSGRCLSEGAHKPGADWSLVEQALALTVRDRAAA
jgi:tRNA-dihydrouridine synthase A